MGVATELNVNDKALLAREIAADRAGYFAESMSSWRIAFMKGWEAAVEWTEEQRQRNEKVDGND
jgi:hypothetical protein